MRCRRPCCHKTAPCHRRLRPRRRLIPWPSPCPCRSGVAAAAAVASCAWPCSQSSHMPRVHLRSFLPVQPLAHPLLLVLVPVFLPPRCCCNPHLPKHCSHRCRRCCFHRRRRSHHRFSRSHSRAEAWYEGEETRMAIVVLKKRTAVVASCQAAHRWQRQAEFSSGSASGRIWTPAAVPLALQSSRTR